MRFLVRLTFGQTLSQVDIWSDVPPRMRLQVRLTFGQMYSQDGASGQVVIWSDVPQDVASGQVDIWSDFSQVDIW